MREPKQIKSLQGSSTSGSVEKGRLFARGWTDGPHTTRSREWLLWVGPLMRARIVTRSEAEVRYCTSLETPTYHDAAEFASLSEAKSWYEQ
jgi:hypothetical protein